MVALDPVQFRPRTRCRRDALSRCEWCVCNERVSQILLVAITSEGRVKSKVEIQGTVVDAPAIAPDGTICFTTDQGYVYAVSDAASPPMDSPWPRFQHDAQNSGRAKLSR